MTPYKNWQRVLKSQCHVHRFGLARMKNPCATRTREFSTAEKSTGDFDQTETNCWLATTADRMNVKPKKHFGYCLLFDKKVAPHRIKQNFLYSTPHCNLNEYFGIDYYGRSQTFA